jgi:hypothetical protein
VTLIQTLTTEDLVIQVADRRLTKANGAVFDDHTTKLVCWRGCFSIGFTGIARIDRAQKEPTSDWIAKLLADCNSFEQGIGTLGREASKQIRDLPAWYPDRRLAIVVAGFDFRKDPQVATIANFRPGGPMPVDPTHFESYLHSHLPGHRSGFMVAGGGLTRPLHPQLLGRYLPKILKQENGVARAAKLMVKIQREVSDDNPRVGRHAMCVAIPRERNNNVIMSNFDGPTFDGVGINFCYFDDEGWTYKQFGPLIANDGTAIDRFEGEADPDNPDNQSVSIRFLKLPRSPDAAESPA